MVMSSILGLGGVWSHAHIQLRDAKAVGCPHVTVIPASGTLRRWLSSL